MSNYRHLKKGEIIQEGDEIDRCVDAWRDDPVWEPAGNIGEPAPDPQYPAHRQYRRPVCERCDGDGAMPLKWSITAVGLPGTYPGPCPVCNGVGR